MKGIESRKRFGDLEGKEGTFVNAGKRHKFTDIGTLISWGLDVPKMYLLAFARLFMAFLGHPIHTFSVFHAKLGVWCQDHAISYRRFASSGNHEDQPRRMMLCSK